jgi:hypothetical protein
VLLLLQTVVLLDQNAVRCSTLDVNAGQYSRFLLRYDPTHVLHNAVCGSVHRPSCSAAAACKWKGAVFVHWKLTELLYSPVTQSLLPLGIGFGFVCGNYAARPESNGKRKAVAQVTLALDIKGSLLYV